MREDKELVLKFSLIPKTCYYSNIRSNVPKEVWDKLRFQTYNHYDYLCAICGEVGPIWPVVCHEVWEYDDIAHIQTLKGFKALCPNCHQATHIGIAKMRKVYKFAIEHFAKVNGITIDRAHREEHKAYTIWNTRSEFKWDVDISILDGSGIDASRLILTRV
jgi:hypothetical protein